MRRKESKTIGLKTQGQNLRILVCDRSGGADAPVPEEVWVVTPIQCLDMAVEWKPRIILVSFKQISLQERDTFVELCVTLKRNRYTEKCTVLVLLDCMHRTLIEDMHRAKVDYIRRIAGVNLDHCMVRRIIESIGLEDRPDSHLAALCPYLHYCRIDSQRELTVCGAYLDRMTLGGRQLHELCETENHHFCEYYQHPRPAP